MVTSDHHHLHHLHPKKKAVSRLNSAFGVLSLVLLYRVWTLRSFTHPFASSAVVNDLVAVEPQDDGVRQRVDHNYNEPKHTNNTTTPSTTLIHASNTTPTATKTGNIVTSNPTATTVKPAQLCSNVWHSRLEPGIHKMPPWILKYVAEHGIQNYENYHADDDSEDSCRRGISTAGNFHASSSDSNGYNNNHVHDDPPRQTFLRRHCRTNSVSCGGLGDRIKGFVMAFYMAMLTNRTILFDGWKQGNDVPVSMFLEPALLPLSLNEYYNKNNDNNSGNRTRRIETTTTTTTNLLWEQLEIKGIQIQDNRQHPMLLDPCRVLKNVTEPVIDLQNNILTYEHVLRQSGCFRKYCRSFEGGGCCDKYNRSLFHLGFSTAFRFSDRLAQDANDLRQTAGLYSPQQDQEQQSQQQQPSPPYIAIHIRTGRGDTFEDSLRHDGESNLKLFYNCAQKLQIKMQRRCQLTSRPLVYVAADNVDAKRQLQRWDTASNSVGTTFKTVNGLEILHIARSNGTKFQNYDLAYRQVWAELKVLIDANCLVMSRSGFSVMASELSPQHPRRCAVMFNDCGDAQVDAAIQALSPTSACAPRPSTTTS